MKSIRTVVAVALFAISFACFGQSFEAACQALGSNVSVTSSPIEVEATPSFVRGIDLTEVRWGGSVGIESLVLSRTVPKTSASRETAIDMAQDPATGKVCYSVNAAVRINYEPLRMEIAREIPVGSCTYQNVLALETQHAGIYREYTKLAAEAAQAKLAPVLTEVRYANSPEEARAAATKLVADTINPALQDAMGVVRSAMTDFNLKARKTLAQTPCNGETKDVMDSIVRSI